jgi:hypothetical protein
LLLNHNPANIIIIGYTRSAVAGNGIGQIYAAGWFTTFAHDHLLLMSQKALPSQNTPRALQLRYAALIVAMIAKTIITVNFFIEM